jgi:nitrate reductase NapD
MSIASLVLHAKPGGADALKREVAAFPGAEVHAVTPDGRLVVTVDRRDDGEAAALVQQLHDLGGVLSASLIYVHYENDASKDGAT